VIQQSISSWEVIIGINGHSLESPIVGEVYRIVEQLNELK
jgi:hypothetical protein